MVTGGAGFIGSHLAERLVELGQKVIVLEDFSAGSEENLNQLRGKSLEIVRGSVTSQEIVEYCVKGVGMIYHLAAKTNIDESLLFPHLFDHVNSSGTLNVLEAARKRDIPMVHMSTSEVYGSALAVPMDESHPLNPQSPYAASKVAAERYCYSYISSYGMRITVLRSFNNYGPRQKGNVLYGGLIASNIMRALSGLPCVIRGDGKQVRDYLYVKDTAEALVDVLSRSVYGKFLNVGTGNGYTPEQLVKMIGELVGTHLEPKVEDARPGDVRELICNAAMARRELGWSPKTSMRKGLRETIAWYRDNMTRFTRFIFPSFKQKL